MTMKKEGVRVGGTSNIMDNSQKGDKREIEAHNQLPLMLITTRYGFSFFLFHLNLLSSNIIRKK